MGHVVENASGHRSRLRKRLFDGGAEALHEHELVEYLLALALPRRDTEPLAKKMSADLGGFPQLPPADEDKIIRQFQVRENVAGAIKTPQATAIRCLKSQVEN